MRKEIDVLMISRPDHSYNIYKALQKNALIYTYMVFKFFPKWLNKLIANNRLREIDKNYSLCWSMTLINTLHYNLRWDWLKKVPEYKVYGPHILRFLWFHKPRLIHYWPEYCFNIVRKYKKKHPNVKTVAEIVFLNEQFVLDENSEYLYSLGLANNIEYIKKNNEITKKVLEFENNFMVPSKLVADSFRKYYPDKNFYVFPYGIHISPHYKRKPNLLEDQKALSFVYAGTISVEKGCDVACKWFSEHADFHLHLYGHLHPKESFIFETFKNFDNIHFHGAVPKIILQNELLQYDAGIHLSRFDSYSLSVAEMIGAGLPVIVSNRAGVCEDVHSGGFGVVVPLDSDLISEAILSFSKSENYNKYLNAIDEYVRNKPATYGDRVVQFYKEILNN